MNEKELLAKIMEKFPAVLESKPAAGALPAFNLTIDAPASSIAEICAWLKTGGLKFDYLACLSGVDLKDKLLLIYHLYSMEFKHKLILKTDLDRTKPELSSVATVWQAANWHEREAYDLFGIKFTGHPYLERILTAEGFEGYPLLKDFIAKPDQYD